MSRVQFAVANGGRQRLTQLIRAQIALMLEKLRRHGEEKAPVSRVVVVGNTVMHHLFCALDVEPLARHPFEPVDDGLRVFRSRELGWRLLDGEAEVRFLPCLGGFVGSDVLAGILATGMNGEVGGPSALLDLGTNGEIVVAGDGHICCASTAAGPAFEGARISSGMRAATGAIHRVQVDGGSIRCEVIGSGVPRGICGSGLVDAVAAGLDLGWIDPGGRLRSGRPWQLAPEVALTQRDVRELQLAKAAVAAGLCLLLRRSGSESLEVRRVRLAGAFGNYIGRESARRIGLLGFPLTRLEPAGNTALRGARLALSLSDAEEEQLCAQVRRQVEHVPLALSPDFQEIFVDAMRFPAAER